MTNEFLFIPGIPIWRDLYIAYLITCIVNKKQYVGVTANDIEVRWSSHVSSANRETVESADNEFYKDIIRYGKDAFEIEIIETNIQEQDLAKQEDYWIRKKCTHKNNGGYNTTYGGNGGITYDQYRVILMSDAETNEPMRYFLSASQLHRWSQVSGNVDKTKRTLCKELKSALNDGTIAFGCTFQYMTEPKTQVIPILRCDLYTDVVVQVFSSKVAVAQWLIDKQLVVKKSVDVLRKDINAYIDTEGVLGGFRWRYHRIEE